MESCSRFTQYLVVIHQLILNVLSVFHISILFYNSNKQFIIQVTIYISLITAYISQILLHALSVNARLYNKDCVKHTGL